jgi:hypothetical protein
MCRRTASSLHYIRAILHTAQLDPLEATAVAHAEVIFHVGHLDVVRVTPAPPPEGRPIPVCLPHPPTRCSWPRTARSRRLEPQSVPYLGASSLPLFGKPSTAQHSLKVSQPLAARLRDQTTVSIVLLLFGRLPISPKFLPDSPRVYRSVRDRRRAADGLWLVCAQYELKVQARGFLSTLLDTCIGPCERHGCRPPGTPQIAPRASSPMNGATLPPRPIDRMPRPRASGGTAQRGCCVHLPCRQGILKSDFVRSPALYLRFGILSPVTAAPLNMHGVQVSLSQMTSLGPKSHRRGATHAVRFLQNNSPDGLQEHAGVHTPNMLPSTGAHLRE